ncbi:MAG: alpha/beta hydrolase [Nitrospinae bacterium]|nr:alpha/beta hydrolase [Nitrospinota bacterium]
MNCEIVYDSQKPWIKGMAINSGGLMTKNIQQAFLHESAFFQGIKDTRIFYQVWKPEHPRGVVLIIHGFTEHSGRYTNVVNTLCPEEYAVWAIDHRGHGKSGGKQHYVDSFKDFFADIAILEKMLRKAHPDLPVHIIGHSMGSLIANHYVSSQEKQDYSSLTLSGTGAAVGEGIGQLQILLSKLLSAFLPKLLIPSGIDPNFISSDQEVVEAYKNDPLVKYQKVTSRLGNELLCYLSTMKCAAKKVTVPTMIQVGSLDDTFKHSSWDELFTSFPSKDKVFQKYEGLKHEVYNEVEKEIPLADLKGWINSHN